MGPDDLIWAMYLATLSGTIADVTVGLNFPLGWRMGVVLEVTFNVLLVRSLRFFIDTLPSAPVFAKISLAAAYAAYMA